MSAWHGAPRVGAVVLAGGQASRMGGVDKGLQLFRGQPLVVHALQRLRQQTLGAPQLLAVNANRNLDQYRQWCDQVWSDTLADFPGPLAGFLAALLGCAHSDASLDLVLTVPCDTPLFPLDLLQRMAEALDRAQADVAIAQALDCQDTGEPVLRNQPVFCLMRPKVMPSLRDSLAQGTRKIGAWAFAQRHVLVPFDGPGDAPNAFFNTNTLEQLHRLEQA